MKKIILTGGGTAGHVMPNIALLPGLRERGFEILYVGSLNGIEKNLMEHEGVPYRGIHSGKLRRYASLQNLTDPFRVLKGFEEAKALLREYQPDVVFSKGGFVSVPVVLAAELLHIPVISHESDMTPGLANRLTMRGVRKICCNFPETLASLPAGKGVVTGCPIRKELLCGDRAEGLRLAGFDGSRPVLLVIGGSLGAGHVNTAVRQALPQLLEVYDIIHICGKGKEEESLRQTPGYTQFGFVNEPLKDLYAAADLVISRAGANAICEIAALKKPNLLIPLGLDASRGDQILNAESFEKQGFSLVLTEDRLNTESLTSAVAGLEEKGRTCIAAMEKAGMENGTENVLRLIEEAAGVRA